VPWNQQAEWALRAKTPAVVVEAQCTPDEDDVPKQAT
jgi:hypothetical protein